MRKMLVTGGAGFIGSNFIKYVLEKYEDYHVINLDKLTYAGNLENLQDVENHEHYTFINGDICDQALVDSLFKTYGIDCIINFAAESHVDRSILDPEVFVRTNVLGTSNLLNTAKKHWLPDTKPHNRFVQVSTDEVYGSLGKTGYFTEESPLDPHSPYAASKASADMLVKAYFDTFGLPVNITRCSNNYGQYQFPEKFIPLIVHNVLNGKPVPIYGDGLNIRDWLYVKDHCAAIDLVLHHAVPGEIYNIGGHNEKSNIELAKIILNLMTYYHEIQASETRIQHVEDRKGHDRRYAIDAGKIQRDLGWSPNTSFEEGMQRTIAWYLNNKDWIQHVTSNEYKAYYKKVYGKEVV